MPDVIVIGGGPGGTAAATRAAQLGGRVTLVERAEMGGNCVNRNCIPLTSLLASIQLLRRVRKAGEMGVDVGPAELNLPAMLARKDQIVQDLREGTAGLLPTFGIEIARGEARLVGPNTVEVDGQRLQAERAIVIATGASWAPLPPGIATVTRPTEALALDRVPDEVLVWGGGAPEVDMATLFSGLGSKVTLVVDGPYPLPYEDYETGQRLQDILQGQGIRVVTNGYLSSVTQTNGKLDVVVATKKGEVRMSPEQVLWAGRVPSTDGLGLAEVGVKLDERGAVIVNDHQQASVPSIYATGDVTGQPMLSALATAGGIVAAENAMGKMTHLDRRAVPRYAFSLPEVAAVGLTEDEAADQGYEFDIANVSFATNPRAMGLNETEGGIKLIADRKLGKVLGVHIVGHGATELIAEAALAIQLETLAEDFTRAIRVHPTLSESMVEAGRAILGEALYVPKF